MAGSFNRITLVGNLTRDPEIRYVGSGAAVTKFTLAVNRRTKQQEDTDYIDCVAWEKLAETANTYLRKGQSVLVDGRLSIRSYEDKEGTKRKAAEVVVSVMQMLDKRAESGESGVLRERPSSRTNNDSQKKGDDSYQDRAPYDDGLEDEVPF